MDPCLSPKKFYSSDKLSPNIKLLRKEKELKESFLPISYKASFADEALCSLWKVFRSQKLALDYSKSKMGLHVFSYESNSFVDNAGQRLFLVTNYKEFWHYYAQLKDEMRIHYEVIPENAPCHLYFDIEFEYEFNGGKNGSKMINTFVELVCGCLRRSGFECSPSDILILASNSPNKFSRHVVIHLPGNLAFKNNLEAGSFAKYVCNSYKSELEVKVQSGGIVDEESSLLVVVDRSSREVETFCDLGVYSKNRNFRLYLSSKRQKGYALRLAPENQYPLVNRDCGDKDEMEKFHKDIFMASLICNVGDTNDLLIYQNDKLVHLSESQQETANCEVQSANNLASHVGSENTIVTRDGQSQLDDFIESLIQIGGIEGMIYRKSLSRDGTVVSYDIIKNRWCRNVERFHKSNNVRLVVDLDRRVWHQKCHDPNCKRINYRSNDFVIPNGVSLEKELELRRPDDDEVGTEMEDGSRGGADVEMEDSSLDISKEALMDILNCEMMEGDTTLHQYDPSRTSSDGVNGDSFWDVTDEEILQASHCEEM